MLSHTQEKNHERTPRRNRIIIDLLALLGDLVREVLLRLRHIASTFTPFYVSSALFTKTKSYFELFPPQAKLPPRLRGGLGWGQKNDHLVHMKPQIHANLSLNRTNFSNNQEVDRRNQP